MKTTRNEFTAETAMFYAASNGGLSGECQRIWPASYLASHVVPNDGRTEMPADKARAVAALLAKGWVERIERTIEVPADTDRYSMFCGTPAHTLVTVAYHATAKGREEWAELSA